MRLLSIALGILLVVSCAQQESEKTFSNTRIILFAGGSPDFFFSAAIARGAETAAQDLGVDLEVVYSDWVSTTMLTQFKQAIDKAPDGIAIMGHPGESQLRPFIEEAFRKGVLVTSLNVDLPTNEQSYKAQGFGYVGQDVGGSGKSLAETAIRKYNLTKGDKVLLFGTARRPIRGARTREARKAFEDKGLEIVYFEDFSEVDLTKVEALHESMVRDMVAQHPDAVLIFDDINVQNTVLALRNLNIDPDEFLVAGFDLSPTVLKDIEEGYIDILSDQQPFLQGYLSVLQLALSHKWRFGGLHIDTGTGIITPENVVDIKPHIASGIR